LKIHEYQAKELFEAYKIPTPKGKVAFTAEDAKSIAKDIAKSVVIKAQVHVGGRGKAGGVKIANNVDEAFTHAKNIIGMDIKGLTVKKVLVAEASKIKREIYLGCILDRSTESVTFMASAAGGVDIEEVAEKTPEKIVKVSIDPLVGFRRYHGIQLLKDILTEKEHLNAGIDIMSKMYQLFFDKDCSLVEINPLIEDDKGKILALDAKINFDDNALYRQSKIEEMKDLTEDEIIEEDAKKTGLSFIPLDGNVGCVVNGAGLAMATMDVVKLFNGNPANFLDVGGSSNPYKVVKAFEILTANKNVKAILFNIFGGITRCDDIANGIVEALNQINLKLPLVIRLTGTNEEEAREILSKRKDLILAKSMNEAVELVVQQLNK